MSSPLNTIAFFREIASIPRESGNEKKISDYLVSFAQKRNLFYKRDEYNNVLIRKKTCEKLPIILQTHMDMVCEKEHAKQFDFATDPIELVEKDGYLMANGTTLGADNGIGMAQVLAILDSNILCNIEAVFTVSEETTMMGAMNFDVSSLEGEALISLDSFEENTIVLESASFYDIVLKTQYTLNSSKNMNAYEINLTGMLGGHSGFDIDKGRGNSDIELAKVLSKITDIEITDFCGGTKFNVIPSQATAKFYTNLTNDEMAQLCKTTQNKLRKEYPELKISCISKNMKEGALDNKQSKEFLEMIACFPHGVIFRNQSHEVTTSVNLGGVNLKSKELKVGMRSTKKIEETECIEMLKKYSKENQLRFNILGSQPGFESKENGKLIQDLLKSHPINLFKQQPILKSMHITLETGIFQFKKPELQIALISPNIQGAHTINEKVEIESINRTDEWLVNFLTSY